MTKILRYLLPLLLTAVLACIAMPAQASGAGSISGTVTVPAGYDPRAVQVRVSPLGSPTSWVGGDWTDSDGNYEVTGLPTGNYTVAFATYWSDMYPCYNRDRWYSGAGQAPAGVCDNTLALTGAATVAVSDGVMTTLGTTPLLSHLPTYRYSGKLVAPPGNPVAGVRAQLWAYDEGAWTIPGGWSRLTNVPVQILGDDGTFSFDLIDPMWSHGYAIRFTDSQHPYTFSFGTGGLDRTSTGAGGASFGDGSVGLLNVPSWTYADVDLGSHQLKFETDYVSGGVTLTGTPEWGRTLTAHADTTWAEAGVGTDFQWIVGDRVVDGAHGPTYVLNGMDDGWGTHVSVRAVPAGAWAYNGPPIESSTLTIENTTPLNVTAPAVIGTPIYGNTLSATTGSWRPTAATYTYSYRWFRGSTPIPGQTTSTHVVGEADIGQRLSVQVSANRPPDCATCLPWFQGPGTGRSKTTVAASLKVLPSSWVKRWPTRSGSHRARVGKKITVTAPTYSTTGKAHRIRARYQWYVSGKAVKGQTARKIKVKKAWRGKNITVRVTISAPGYTTRSKKLSSGKIR